MEHQNNNQLILLATGERMLNRSISAAMEESGLSFITENEPNPDNLSPILSQKNPKLICTGAFLARTRMNPHEIEAFKLILAHYRKFYKAKMPILFVLHEGEKDIDRFEGYTKAVYSVKIPSGCKTEELNTIMIGAFQTIDQELKLGFTAFQKAPEKKEKQKPVKYSEKDFKADYSMEDHKLYLGGPLIGRAFARIDMILKKEKVHQDVKINGPKDRDAKHILIISWKDINFIAEQTEHHTFRVLRDLMKNGVYEVIQFEDFKNKEPLFNNKTHYELYENRFCPEIE